MLVATRDNVNEIFNLSDINVISLYDCIKDGNSQE